ncbi:hypothetical protein ACH5RR_015066 [Cinchona calisaya]|uniref:Polyphenol oxidase C-terminal domain-containing protein n=1 Tax=Cinchona calisaya TaxID=153742 RepID=A0ABD2ZUS5_9GENT
MSSLSTTTAGTATLSSLHNSPSLASKTLFHIPTTKKSNHQFKVSCKKATEGEQNAFSRRNLLIGLGGVYGAAANLATDPFAFASTTSAADVFPAKLDKVVKILVKRPKNKKKDEDEEILVIEKIEVERDVFVKFDVFINEEDDNPKSTPENTEFGGSFVNLPRKNNKQGKKIKTGLNLSLTEILQDLDAENDDHVLVSLVPRIGCDALTIGGIKIILD